MYATLVPPATTTMTICSLLTGSYEKNLKYEFITVVVNVSLPRNVLYTTREGPLVIARTFETLVVARSARAITRFIPSSVYPTTTVVRQTSTEVDRTF